MIKRLLYSLVAAGVFTVQALCHDLHQSTGEAEYNLATKRLEVSLTFFTDDLEVALMRFSERQVSLRDESSERTNEILSAYLKKTFVVKDNEGAPSPWIWVGRELEKPTSPTAGADGERVTVYFEIELPSGLQGCTVTSTALHECYQDQMNLISIKNGPTKTEQSFTRSTVTRPLDR